jgi:hypothetical protein
VTLPSRFVACLTPTAIRSCSSDLTGGHIATIWDVAARCCCIR